MKNGRGINLHLRLLLSVGLLLPILILIGCPKEESGKRSLSAKSAVLNTQPTPSALAAVTLTPDTLRGWHKEIVGSNKPDFRPVTFTIPDTPLTRYST